jgi:hypothetical protein
MPSDHLHAGREDARKKAEVDRVPDDKHAGDRQRDAARPDRQRFAEQILEARRQIDRGRRFFGGNGFRRARRCGGAAFAFGCSAASTAFCTAAGNGTAAAAAARTGGSSTIFRSGVIGAAAWRRGGRGG